MEKHRLSDEQRKANARANVNRWRRNNLERARKRERDWYAEHKETQRKKIREKVARYRKENPAKFKEVQKRFYVNNPGSKSEHDATYRRKNIEKLRLYHKEMYKEKKESIRARIISKTYGITIDDYNVMFDAQNGKCGICGSHQSELTKRLFVDHNHETGAIRELLCLKCNAGLGMFRDDSKLIQKAIEYLKRHDR